MDQQKNLVLIGGGGHCKSVLDAALNMDLYNNIVITDPGIQVGTKIMGCKVVGSDELLPELYKSGYSEAFITIGSIKSSALRRKLFEKAQYIGFEFSNIIDPSAVVSSFAVLGCGVFLGKNVVINADVQIGNCSIVNTGAIVEHECIIGSFSHISVGTVLCGNVQVGDDAFVGSNSTVIQGINIGNGSIIGAGSMVLANVDSNKIIYGLIDNKISVI